MLVGNMAMRGHGSKVGLLRVLRRPQHVLAPFVHAIFEAALQRLVDVAARHL